MTSARWCPVCRGAKAPSDEICLACGIVRSSERRAVSRPQPPMQDRRTKRERTRSAQNRRAIEEG